MRACKNPANVAESPPEVGGVEPSWRQTSLRPSVFSAPLRRLAILTALNLAILLASPAAAQRDPEVDVRARLFAEVGAGVAAIKSRTVAVGQTSRSALFTDSEVCVGQPSRSLPLADRAAGAAKAGNAEAPPSAEAGKVRTPGAGALGGTDREVCPTEEKLYYLLIPALRTEGAEPGGATVLVFRDDGTRVAQIPAPRAAERAKAAAGAASGGRSATPGAATASSSRHVNSEEAEP